MKLNYDTVIVGQNCVLVPYRPEHVERYHAWMQAPELLQATGSEPLSLQEEYDMQQSWRDDDAKCTFIVLARDHLDDKQTELLDETSNNTTLRLKEDFIQTSVDAMVGDVNLFLSEEEEEENDNPDALQTEKATSSTIINNAAAEKHHHAHRIQAELDIMIAEKDCRGKGVGREASCLMMLYGATHLSIRRFFCKINEDNQPSLGLFQSKLMDFQQCNYAACFRQIELERKEESPSRMVDKLSSLLGLSSSGLRTIQLSSTSTTNGDSQKERDATDLCCE